MKRISQNRDLFQVKPGESIIVTVDASSTPYEATFSKLESSGQWTVIQSPTPAVPTEKRQFTMPAGSREFFVVVYAFPPSGQTNPAAKYQITLAGGGTTDGPNDVLPPPVGDIDDLPYEFRPPE